MVGHFVRLKLRLLGNRIRRSDVWGILGLILVWSGALGGGLLLGVVFGLGAGFLPGPELAVAVAVAVHLGWVLFPVMVAALDDTLEPRRFELLPLRPVELAGGLLVASLVGPGAALTMILMSVGLAVGYWPGWAGPVVVPFLALTLTVIAAATARLVTTLLSDMLASRRGREAANVVAPVLGVAVAVLASFFPLIGPEVLDQGLPEGLTWLAVLPSGAVGAAAVAFSRGDVVIGLVATAWSLVGAAVLVAAWAKALARLQVRAASAPVARPQAKAGTILGMGLSRFVRSHPVRASVAKELRYAARDHRLRAQIFGGLVAAAAIGFAGFGPLTATAFGPFLATLATWIVVSTFVPNQFGVDAGTFWAYVVSPTDLSAALVGKNIAWAVVAVPVGLAAGVVGALGSGDARYLPAALLGAAALLLVWMAVGNLSSIWGAYPWPERQLFGNTNASGRVLVASLAGLAASGALSGPPAALVVAGVVLGGPPAAALGALVGFGYSAVLYLYALRWARSVVVDRRFHLLEVLDAG